MKHILAMMNIVLAVFSSASPVSSMGTSPGKSGKPPCGLFLRMRLKRTENMLYFKAVGSLTLQ